MCIYCVTKHPFKQTSTLLEKEDCVFCIKDVRQITLKAPEELFLKKKKLMLYSKEKKIVLGK